MGIGELERELGHDFNIRLEDNLIWVGARSDLIERSRRRADGWRRNQAKRCNNGCVNAQNLAAVSSSPCFHSGRRRRSEDGEVGEVGGALNNG